MEGSHMIVEHSAIMMCIGICTILLFWVLFREKCLEVIARIIVGCIIIYFVNKVVPQYAIGINALSIICSGLLGVPGVGMLYMIGFLA